jgi:hypothetical protein
MIIDFHTHIFPKPLRENREAYFQGEPEFKLLYDSPKSRLCGARELVSAMDRDGVDLSVVFGFPWRQPEHFMAHNDYILDSVRRYPDRLVGFCCLDVSHGQAAREAERCLSGGLSGVGELAFYQAGIDREALAHLEPIMALCREKAVPVLIHTNEPVGHWYPGKAPMELSQIYRMATTFPENRMVLAHWGGGLFFYYLMKKEVKERLGHLYVDTAASPFLYDPQVFEIAVKIMGSDRILFGSDFPLLKPARYFADMDGVKLIPGDREKICGLNAQNLLGLAMGRPRGEIRN